MKKRVNECVTTAMGLTIMEKKEDYDAEAEWNKAHLAQNEMMFPSEYVIRIFKGKYPGLNLDKTAFKGMKVCDVGCGDGANLTFLNKLGMKLFGIEITQKIVDDTVLKLKRLGLAADVRVGKNDYVPFGDAAFDYVLSWNACYYMGQSRDFGKHVHELARIAKPGGVLVLSIPKKTCFIYVNSRRESPGYAVITSDPFNVRNGEVLRIFENEEEIRAAFEPYFEDFRFGSIHDDCFGLNYHWHLVVCKRK